MLSVFLERRSASEAAGDCQPTGIATILGDGSGVASRGNLEPSMHALQWVRQVWQHQIL